MAKAKVHLTPNGPNMCRANPDKPGGRACRYESGGHFNTVREADEAFAAKLGGSIPEISRKPPRLTFYRPPNSSYSRENIEAIREYRDGANWGINESLRGGVEPSGKDNDTLRKISSIIETSEPLSESAIVQRSLYTANGKAVKIPSVGEIYSDQALLSCSSNAEYIEKTLDGGIDDFSIDSSDTILSIELPKGAKVLALNFEDEDFEVEAEIILPRDSKMEITEDSGFVNGVRRIKARLILA